MLISDSWYGSVRNCVELITKFMFDNLENIICDVSFNEKWVNFPSMVSYYTSLCQLVAFINISHICADLQLPVGSHVLGMIKSLSTGSPQAGPLMVTMLTTMWLISNSMWLSDTIWWQISESTLAQVLACCLMAPSHYLSQCWLIINDILRHSPEGNFIGYLSLIWFWKLQV